MKTFETPDAGATGASATLVEPHPPSPPAVTSRSVFRDLRDVLTDVIEYRELLVELTRRDLRIRYKQAVMGLAWAVITPLILVLSGVIVRYAFSAGQVVPRAAVAGLAVKALGWSFFVGALGFGTTSLTANLQLVTKTYFPRELLPLATLLTQIVDLGVGAAVLVVALPIAGVGSLGGLVWLPLLVVLLVLLTTAACLLASAANVFFRDARYIVQLATSFGVFFTPVFFNLDMWGERGARLLVLNPVAPILEGARLALIDGHDLRVPIVSASGALQWSPWYLIYAGAFAAISALFAAVVFHRAESRFAELV